MELVPLQHGITHALAVTGGGGGGGGGNNGSSNGGSAALSNGGGGGGGAWGKPKPSIQGAPQHVGSAGDGGGDAKRAPPAIFCLALAWESGSVEREAGLYTTR
jgi:hypothetical protein